MKTVMKKMFSLLLVAVLLVSAVPVAFAAEGDVKCPNGHDAVYSRDYTAATCTADQVVVYKCTKETAEECVWVGEFYYTVPNTKLSHSYTAVVTTPATCTAAGEKTLTCTCGDTTTEPIAKLGHSFASGVCATCGICEDCGYLKASACICCDKCDGTTVAHASNCPTLLCPNGCGAANHSGFCCTECNKYGHQKTACPNLYETCCNVAKGSAHRADCVTRCTGDRDCKNANHKTDCKYALCDVAGCTKNEGHSGEHAGVPCSDTNCNKNLSHDGKHSYLCPNAGCDKAVGHSGNCSNVPETIPGNSYLTINVNLYTSDVKTDTIHLKTYKDISKDTRVYNFISDRVDEINALLPNGYVWSGNVYNNKNKNEAEAMNATVGTGRTVYINAYSDQDLVLIAVHNRRTMSTMGNGYIHLYGKKIGDTVTKQEVLKAVSKVYNVNSLSMYSEQAWEDYVDGATVQSVDTLTVTKDPFFIDVRISGSAKSTSGSGSTADSTNPKTGDAIFAPAMILGLSASALVVLYYLNKKRAF